MRISVFPPKNDRHSFFAHKTSPNKTEIEVDFLLIASTQHNFTEKLTSI